VQTYGTLTVEQRTYFVSRTLRRLIPYLPLLKDAVTDTVGANTGTTIQWRKWGALPAAVSALTEGVPPTEGSLTITAVTAALAQYGAFQKISDLLIRAGIDPALANVSDLEGEQAGLSVHSLMSTELGAGSSVQYASTATSRITVAAGMNFITAEVRKAVRTLEKANVPRFPDNLFHGSVTPSQKYDLKADAGSGGAGGFLDIMRYSRPEAFLTGTLGEVEGVAFDVSTANPIFTGAGAAGIDVHAALIWGPQAFGAIDLAGMTLGSLNAETEQTGIDIMVVPANTPSKIDPLQQYGVAGWKVAFVAKTLDSARILRVETAVAG
jgi:N4-gp56 family major capsid protein